MIDNNKKVNFTGKEYIEYCKYKDAKAKANAKWFTKNRTLLLSGLAIICITLIAIMAIGLLSPEPEPTQWTWNGIFMFLAVCAGVSWVVHGFGFLLVRR